LYVKFRSRRRGYRRRILLQYYSFIPRWYTRVVCQNIIYEHYYYYYYYCRPPPAPSPVVYTALLYCFGPLVPVNIYCSTPNSDNFPTRLSRLNWFVNETACHSKTVYNLNETRNKKWFKTNVIFITKQQTYRCVKKYFTIMVIKHGK